MKIIKRGHACLELVKGNERLIIDPGFYTEPMVELHNVVGIVITHMHDDHCYEEQLDRIASTNPTVSIFGTDEVRSRLDGRNVTAVHHGDWHKVGNFELEFFGDMHQEIHRTMPLIQNTGVMVDDRLYYPGDSYTQPDRPVEMLACPTSAPWLKIGDVIDFVAAVKPRKSFATHNALLSEFGHALNNGRVKMVTEAGGGEFTYLEVGQSLEL
ncbi:MAG: MBL fold metallo-hydrolase [Microbacteriaceae bacterium]|nr:MBL fold metallo-hydrolase [Microbacteriaceae bacterium]